MYKKEEIKFHGYVEQRAKYLLDEIKRKTSTYGEIKEELQKYEKSVKWSNSQGYYLVIITAAKLLLDKEIDAITH